MTTDERKPARDHDHDDDLGAVEERESLKYHGDALNDGSTSRQGDTPEPARDTTPREVSGER